MGRKKRKNKKPLPPAPTDGENTGPQSMIFRRGKVGLMVQQLELDLRKTLSPNTAKNLKEKKRNTLQDFVNVAPTINVTHLLVFKQSTVGVNLRLIRVPRGPTLTFRVQDYSLMKDVHNMQKRPHAFGANEMKVPPLVVLNNFSSNDNHMKLMTAMFQSLFPPLDLEEMKLSSARRVVLLDYDDEKDSISFRHYLITLSPVGINKNIKRIIKAKVPNLNHLTDISEAIDLAVQSDSEAEDIEGSRVTLSDNYRGRGNRRNHKSAIRLKELGPRMSLQLLKIETGVGTGEVLYNKLQSKTESEKQALKERKRRQKTEKERRIKEQEENIARKAKDKSTRHYIPNDNVVESDDDAEWYRAEVGEEPHPDLFDNKKKKKVAQETKDDDQAITETTSKKKGSKRDKANKKRKAASGTSSGAKKSSKLKKQKR